MLSVISDAARCCSFKSTAQCMRTDRLRCSPGRVVQQAATLAARVAGGADPLAPQQLVNLLRALTGCLSLLRQRVHDELLAQALGVSLWSCAQVCAAAHAALQPLVGARYLGLLACAVCIYSLSPFRSAIQALAA